MIKTYILKLTRKNLKVVWPELSTLDLAVGEGTAVQPSLKLKAQAKQLLGSFSLASVYRL
jgi:hypothetical protein